MEKLNCTCCNKQLRETSTVWLELSNTDYLYYYNIPDGHASQGGFPFGKSCAKNEIKKNSKTTAQIHFGKGKESIIHHTTADKLEATLEGLRLAKWRMEEITKITYKLENENTKAS